MHSKHIFNANVGFYCPQKPICILPKNFYDPPTYDTTNLQLKQNCFISNLKRLNLVKQISWFDIYLNIVDLFLKSGSTFALKNQLIMAR